MDSKVVLKPLALIDTAFEQLKIQEGYDLNLFDLPQELKDAIQFGCDDIPSMNHVNRMHLQPNSLVRFRGMIQDTRNPEIFLDVYTVRELNGEITCKTSRYRDVTHSNTDCEILFDSPLNKYGTRQAMHCVPVPGENSWARDSFLKMSQHLDGVYTLSNEIVGIDPTCGSENDLSTSMRGVKRMNNFEDDDLNISCNLNDSDKEDTKRAIQADISTAAVEQQGQTAFMRDEHVHNLPLPDTRTPALIKIYGDNHDIRMHDVVEVIGIYTFDPEQPVSSKSQLPLNSDHDMVTDHEQEFSSYIPPPSVLPRIHCLHVIKRQHNNPLLPRELTSLFASAELSALAGHARPVLLGALSDILCGDDRAAKCILLHLLSSVHTRSADCTLTLGHLPINLFGFNDVCSSISQRLASFFETVIVNSHVVPMQLEHLNTARMSPKKNDVTDCIEAGILQLAPHTHLLLDETVLAPGQLNEQGIKNILALQQVVQSQQVAYDFEHAGPLLFNVDIQILVLSEGKSMLPILVRIPFTPTRDASQPMIAHEHLVIARKFLDLAKQVTYTIEQDIQQILLSAASIFKQKLTLAQAIEISQDFAAMRQHDPSISADRLHQLLGFARLLSLSYGSTSLSRDCWQEAKELILDLQEANENFIRDRCPQ